MKVHREGYLHVCLLVHMFQIQNIYTVYMDVCKYTQYALVILCA